MVSSAIITTTTSEVFFAMETAAFGVSTASTCGSRDRLQSGIDGILHIVDWVPVRLVGVVYALLGHGEKANHHHHQRGFLRHGNRRFWRLNRIDVRLAGQRELGQTS
jgi:membrane protein required for beta-lactamase induction